MTSVLKTLGYRERETSDTQTTMGPCSKKAPICQPRRGALEETKPADILILDFYPPQLWGNKLLFKPLSLCILLQQPELAQEDSSIRVRTGGEKKLLERMLKEHSLSASCKWRFSTQAALPVSASLSLALLVPHLPHPSPSPGKPALYNPNQLGSNKPDKTERRDHIPEPWKR